MIGVDVDTTLTRFVHFTITISFCNSPADKQNAKKRTRKRFSLSASYALFLMCAKIIRRSRNQIVLY